MIGWSRPLNFTTEVTEVTTELSKKGGGYFWQAWGGGCAGTGCTPRCGGRASSWAGPRWSGTTTRRTTATFRPPCWLPTRHAPKRECSTQCIRNFVLCCASVKR